MVIPNPQPTSSPSSLHDEIMDNLIVPSWLCGGSLRDPLWKIRSPDRQDADDIITLAFDQGISPWPNVRSLLDPAYELDLITLKLVMYHGLQAKPIGWMRSTGTARVTFAKHLAFIRWKVDRGIGSNEQLNAAWFNEFHSSMKDDQRKGLLRLPARVNLVLAAYDRGECVLEPNRRGEIGTGAFARLIGLTHGTEIPRDLRNQVEDFFRARGLYYSRFASDREEKAEHARRVTRAHANSFYRVWWDLWKIKDHLAHDPIIFRAFKKKSEISRYISSWTRVAERTEDAPPYQTSCLINSSLSLLFSDVVDNAIELVERGVDEVGQVRDLALLGRINSRLAEYGFGTVGALYHNTSWRKCEQVTVAELLFVVVPAAARVVIAAFSARRDEETTSLRADCIEDEDAEHPWLLCRIAKNMRRIDRIPIPRSVVKAIEVVKRIRSIGDTQGSRLFEYSCPVRKKTFKFRLAERLDLVRDFLNVPLMDDGSPWHFTPHQFRKFFGVTYHWRWAFPDLTALSYHYRQFNPDTTRAYIEMKAAEALRMRDDKLAAAVRRRELERKKDLDDGQGAFIKWVIEGVLGGQELGGSFGRRLMQQVEDLKQKILPEMEITQDDTCSGLGQILHALVSSNQIRVHPEGHSLCGCRGHIDDTSVSVCLRLKQMLTGITPSKAEGPDYTFADDEGCLACPHRGALPSMAPYWDHAARQAIDVLAGATGELAQKSIQRIRMIEKYA